MKESAEYTKSQQRIKKERINRHETNQDIAVIYKQYIYKQKQRI